MQSIVEEINNLKKDKNAIILAHYYQDNSIQEIADFTGDSFALAQQALKTDAEMIVFSGVHFMAETAKILNPNKKVVLPDLDAGCSLADSCPPHAFKEFLSNYPNHKVVTYINCSAEIKAMSDIICTSSNAEKIISSMPKDEKIIFAPDKNLGRYLNEKTGRKMVLWNGTCLVHESFSIGKLLKLFKENPTAKIIAHPESEKQILDVATFIGSTAKMIDYVSANQGDIFIVATEVGILCEMQALNPKTKLIPAPSKEDNACACSECAFMKLNTLEKLRDCLKNEMPQVIIDENTRLKALSPILKMLDYA